MTAFDDAPTPTYVLRVQACAWPTQESPRLLFGDDAANDLARQLPRHASAVRVGLDARARVWPTSEPRQLQQGLLCSQRHEHSNFVVLEADQRWFTGDPLHAHVVDVAHPLRQMGPWVDAN